MVCCSLLPTATAADNNEKRDAFSELADFIPVEFLGELEFDAPASGNEMDIVEICCWRGDLISAGPILVVEMARLLMGGLDLSTVKQ
jgi:hypothetical protein